MYKQLKSSEINSEYNVPKEEPGSPFSSFKNDLNYYIFFFLHEKGTYQCFYPKLNNSRNKPYQSNNNF